MAVHQIPVAVIPALRAIIARQPNNFRLKKMVKIYSTPSCVYCKTLKEYLQAHNVEFQEIDVSKNEKDLQEMIKISGQMAVPVVDIDGEAIVGFDKVRIDKLLKITS